VVLVEHVAVILVHRRRRRQRAMPDGARFDVGCGDQMHLGLVGEFIEDVVRMRVRDAGHGEADHRVLFPGAGPVESRTTSSTSSCRVRTVLGRNWVVASSSAAAPMSVRGRCTVVSGGWTSLATPMSLKPATEIWSGTAMS